MNRPQSTRPELPWRRRLPLSLLSFCLVLLATATGTAGQRLLRVVPPDDDTVRRASRSGWAIEADHDLVRLDPAILDLEDPAGRAFSVQRTLFEDRGDGDAMWVGRYPGHDHDSVVLTLQDGYLLGYFGLPEGGAWSIRSGRDGGGRMDEVGGGPVSCGGGLIPERDFSVPPPEAARLPAPLGSVVSESSRDRLDILVLYTPSAAATLERAGYGPPSTAMQQAEDYLNLVFRNSRLGALGRIVAIRRVSASLEQAEEPLKALRVNRDARSLRAAYRADLVHLFIGTEQEYCGIAYLLTRGHTAATFSNGAYGVTVVGDRCLWPRNSVPASEVSYHLDTFVHEVGHNLGANHNPGDAKIASYEAVAPYAYGDQDRSNDPPIRTLMSYAHGTADGRRVRGVPFYSNVFARPRGARIGIAGERENARALQRTIHVGVRYSDYLPASSAPTAPTNLRGIATSGTSVRLTWRDRSNNETSFDIWARPLGGDWSRVLVLAANTRSVNVTGLQAGGSYHFVVRARNSFGYTDSEAVFVSLPTAPGDPTSPTGCEWDRAISTLNGYTVSLCFEDPNSGEIKAAFQVWKEGGGAVLGFFDRSNPEVLVKVLDGCAHNGHRWVFVAPVTTLAFELNVRDPQGRRWTHRNFAGRTAQTRSDTEAFSCSDS